MSVFGAKFPGVRPARQEEALNLDWHKGGQGVVRFAAIHVRMMTNRVYYLVHQYMTQEFRYVRQ